MGFIAEHREDLRRDVDCYWDASLPEGVDELVFPSLPEPYINLFIPIAPGLPGESLLKGISDRADLFPMRSALFGVRLHIRGLYRAGWGNPAALAGMTPSGNLADYPSELDEAIRNAEGFERRVFLFREWLSSLPEVTHGSRADRVSSAHEYLLENFKDPAIIQSWSSRSGYSVRTINRWFTLEIGMSPKKLARVARFHSALSGLHGTLSARYYLDAGYYDQAHFIKEFKEFTAMTPEHYLEMVGRLAG